jgi:RND family efflux transporter MFP subunit
MSSSSLTRASKLLRRIVCIGVVVFLVIVATGISMRIVEARRIKVWTDTQAVPSVNLVRPGHDANGQLLDLPGRLEAYTNAPIFARVGGYLKSWHADIGARVKAGQLLAEIETPELDQQLLQAKADLSTARANAALAGTTAHRWQALLSSDSVSRQEVDERTAGYAAKEAIVAAAQANVDRLLATKAFARIVAPFDGVVTVRKTDVGALINAGSGGSGQELFAVSDVSRLRVYVQVPQNYAPLVRLGATASLTVPEYPGQRFDAHVAASADAVNAATGTTLIQLLVDNSASRLMPGGFANIQIRLPVQADALHIPASVLVFDAHGLRVATVDANAQVRFKTVTIAHDFGNSVEIGSGLNASDRIIDTPPDDLVDGERVRITSSDQKVNASA